MNIVEYKNVKYKKVIISITMNLYMHLTAEDVQKEIEKIAIN